MTAPEELLPCPLCHGLNTSCPDGCDFLSRPDRGVGVGECSKVIWKSMKRAFWKDAGPEYDAIGDTIAAPTSRTSSPPFARPIMGGGILLMRRGMGRMF